MKLLPIAVLLACLLGVRPAEGIVDPDPNSLGFFFDQNADLIELSTAPFNIIDAHLILTNPTFASIKGIECQLDYDETLIMTVSTQPIIPEVAWMGDPHTVIMGFAYPVPTTSATILMTYRLLPISLEPIHFTLGGVDLPSIPGDLPVAVDGDDNLIQLGLTTWVGEVCAMINDLGVVDAQSQTWGGVKSLYR